MQMDEKLYRAFLEQMHELEAFRMAYAARHPSAALDRDDPDVKRLVEALSFFAARTHIAAMNTIIGARLRIFQQFFPFLLSPLPAMGMVQARPTGRFSDTAVMPGGARILVSPKIGAPGLFRTMKQMEIQPLALTDSRLLLRPDKGFRLILDFESRFQRTEAPGMLSIHIDHLNNYQSSLLILDTIRIHLTHACAVFDQKADERATGRSSPVSFGSLPRERDKMLRKLHPLQQARLFFHYPHQELFLNIKIPDPGKPWQRMSVCLDLDPGWPKKIVLNKDIFRLYAVPMENLVRESPPPFIYQGTKEKFYIRHPESEQGYALQSVLGVYEIRDGGQIPLRPGILSGGEGSYEIEQKRDPDGRIKYLLNLHYSRAFLEPVTIVADCLWHQPGFSKRMQEQLGTRPYTREIPGVEWDHSESMVPHGDNPFQENMDEFMHLLTIKKKAELTFDDLVSLLRMLGSVWQGDFKPVEDLFYTLRVEQAPRTPGNGSLHTLVYYLGFKVCEPGLMPMVKVFTGKVEAILDAWISEARIETRVEMDTV